MYEWWAVHPGLGITVIASLLLGAFVLMVWKVLRVSQGR
jgi:hypothetical protein